MTPNEIEILLHYYYRTDDHADMFDNEAAWRVNRDLLRGKELLKETEITGSPVYRLTDRALVYIRDGLLQVPLPEAKWVIPRSTDPDTR